MADEIDQANEQAERWLAEALSVRAVDPNRPQPKGSCHFCEMEFEQNDPDLDKKLFCDRHCSADFEKEKLMKSRR